MNQNMAFQSGRSSFLSTLPLFRKSSESEKDETRRLKFYQLYRFADIWDIFLMIIGTIAAIIAGSLYSVMLILYRRAMTELVNLGKLKANITTNSTTTTNLSECFIVPNNSTTFDSSENDINDVVNYYVLVGFLSVFFYWLAWICWILSSERQVRRMRYALFRNILRQEIGWFDVHNTGELSNHLIRDLDTIKDGMNDKMADFIALLSRVIASIIYGLLIGWKLTLVFLSVTPLVVLSFNFTVVVIIKYTKKEIEAFVSASSIAQEVLQSIRTVTAFHGQKKEEERFSENLILAKQIGIKKGLYMGLSQCLYQIFLFFAFGITFWYGPELVRTDCTHYSAGTVLAVFIGCMVATFSLSQFVPNFQSFAEAFASGSYVFNIIDRQTAIDVTSNEGDTPQKCIGNIVFDNVMFSYPARPEALILNRLSLNIPSGKTIAIVGESGNGKSTIIQRFYDPDEGQIFLDGKDVKTLNVAWLRSHIGIVSQEPVLFNISIEDNILFGKPNATDDEIEAAAKMANAHDFIMELPEKYKTLAGDKLSGGQKQRVAIARALISDPKILLLDEATSALDNTSERIVQDALDKAKMGRTTIVIAHRLSTIQNADLILVLEHGQMVEYGIHNELMEQKGFYYELVTTRSKKEEEEQVHMHIHEEEEDEDEIEKSVSHTLPKQISLSSDVTDENMNNNDDIKLNDSLEKPKKSFNTPLIFQVFKLNLPEWYWILLGTISSIIFGATPPLVALIFSEVYSLFAEPDVEKQKHLTIIYAASIFAIGIVGGVAQCLSTAAFAKSGEEFTMRMRKKTFSAILQQDMEYFDQESNSVGALVTRLATDASALKVRNTI
ncbi:unnamed protein product [Adineta steineri]|uniref:Uncharacterized protein n=1 Tax=Adineta steineri TaxID=433720 RepID=A0A815K6R0_9BILA|nr:unnamed protein product [Adineta steineri]CAF1391488.1 unnamed protein product [Adineta steineri]CAF1611104.1 unnamed protein product [Adineta steineri]CAF1611192.1 unnamed protein product [Adineta steineri]